MAFVGAAAMEIWPKEASAAVGEFTSAFFFFFGYLWLAIQGTKLVAKGRWVSGREFGRKTKLGFLFHNCKQVPLFHLIW